MCAWAPVSVVGFVAVRGRVWGGGVDVWACDRVGLLNCVNVCVC